MEDKKVIIDREKCIGCGQCVKDCVGFDIELRDGKAYANGKSCIKCGHCEAICPSNAVTLTGFTDEIEEFEQQTRLDPQELMKAIKTRRSIRQFIDKEVSDEVVEMILEAGRLAPTAANGQKTSYVVLKDKKNECEAFAVGMFAKLVNTGKKVVSALSNMNIDENFFFKKAPVVIVICSNDKVSASLAAQNMAFMAEANGLGVLFSGFFTTCFNMNGKIRRVIGVPNGTKAVTTLVIGYPAVRYKRTVHRNDAKVIKA